jgi:hypothetical protein
LDQGVNASAGLRVESGKGYASRVAIKKFEVPGLVPDRFAFEVQGGMAIVEIEFYVEFVIGQFSICDDAHSAASTAQAYYVDDIHSGDGALHILIGG